MSEHTCTGPLEGLMEFLQSSPTAFHAVENIRRTLLDAGFTELPESSRWELAPGGSEKPAAGPSFF